MLDFRSMRVAPLFPVIARASEWVSPRLRAWIAVAFLACSGSLVAASPAGAEPSIKITPAAPLSAVGAPLEVTLTASLGGLWAGASTVIEVRGPGSTLTTSADWPVRARVETQHGDLGAGKNRLTVTLDPGDLPVPGAYLLRADLVAEGGKRVSTEIWCGRISDLPEQVDVAVLIPVVSGVRRDPGGVFVDDLVRNAVSPRAEHGGSLFGLFSAIEQNPNWHLTLGIEPLFLAQIRDLSDGYQERIGRGAVTEVPAGTGAALDAEQSLATLRGVVALEQIQAIPTPYAMPALPVLAREGWEDGFEQMQLGKLEFQSTLEMPGAPDGAYAPGLDITTDSLSTFSRASIDYLVVREEVARDLAEAPATLRRPVRVQNRDNDRLTLVFADEELRAAMAPPWDSARFAAALAATVAKEGSGLIVATPSDEYGMPPADYLRELGALLTAAPWIRTQTLDEALRENPPDTRPVSLSRYGGFVEGYVEREFVEGLKTAHAAVDALAGAADSDRAPVQDLRRMLYEAESRYWFVAGADPHVANLGLSYLDAIEGAVAEEFDAIDVAGDKSVIIVGESGEVPVAVVNKAGYPMALRLVVTGDGVEIEDGGVLDVNLATQENIFSLPVTVSGGRSVVEVQVLAGDIMVDQETIEIRSIPVGPVVAWVAAIVAVIGLVGWAIIRRR